MTRFRVAKINVHSFNNPSDYESNIEELISILKPLNLDLIAVQEIQKNSHWSNFCKHLSLPFAHIGSGDGNYYGIGIASRYPIISPYDQQTSFASLGGKRFFFKCCLGGDHPFVKDRIFAVTHLDHLNENDRLIQINHFSPVGRNVNILMGDMNALTRDDYSDDYYQKNLVQVREKSNWERPCFDLTRLITTTWAFQDAFKQINPQLKDESVTTSRYGTRIDYIYWRPRNNDE
ncbi:unnamed protein product [Rotaria sordida]|uniref:Endonuclease/exonuclease/phosphatase domain-containing protein n=1 Tax=Rotaria sordida TaxID=392033 RepID=A0A815B0B5_9BILA|nr:unnamed protein product [Rotaria sordida]CAF1543409.1 unnamed protein product [Rotaria sordida]